MNVEALYNSSLDIQSLLKNESQGINNKNNSNNLNNQTANYAKKGEPMYMEDMDTDKDGVVTLDEYREYCKSKGINTNNMLKMSQMAASYRTMQAETETMNNISKLIPNITPIIKQANSGTAQVKNNENKYNISNDSNNTKNVSYKEYMNYCEQNATTHTLKSNAKIDNTDNKKFSITKSGNAINSYKINNKYTLKSTFEEKV